MKRLHRSVNQTDQVMLCLHKTPAERAFDMKLLSQLRSLIRELGLSRHEIAKAMQVSLREYEEIRDLSRQIKAIELARLAETYQFSVEAFLEDRIDFEALRRQLFGNTLYIPEKYTKGGFSKRMMAINILNYVRKTYGQDMCKNLMDRFHLNPNLYSDPFGPMNYVLFEEMIAYLRQWGFGDLDVYRIGNETIDTYRDTWFANEMASHECPADLYERYMTELIVRIEKNNLYKLVKLDSDSCTTESHEVPELLDVFGVRHVGGSARCLYRTGALAAATRYLDLPFAKVTEIKCVHRGDSVCAFVIDYRGPNLFQKRKLRSHLFQGKPA